MVRAVLSHPEELAVNPLAGHGLCAELGARQLLADPHHGFARIHTAPPGGDLWWHFERLMIPRMTP